MGDKWFGGRTRNPWNPGAGLERLFGRPGQRRCRRLRGLRHRIGNARLHLLALHALRRSPACGPAFGLVPRTGAMALSWTMDKLGPICRSVEDCALVLEAIHGPDGKDLSAAPRRLRLESELRLAHAAHRLSEKRIRPAAAAQARQKPRPTKPPEEQEEARRAQRRAAGRARPPRLRPPLRAGRARQAARHGRQSHPGRAAQAAVGRHGAAAHRRGRRGLRRADHDRPRQPAHRAGRRRLAQRLPHRALLSGGRVHPGQSRAHARHPPDVATLFEQVDIIVTPSTDTQLIATNLTGNPARDCCPTACADADAPPPPAIDDGDHDDIGGPGTPVSITFLGGLYQDAKLAAFARAYQEATGFQKLHPKLD